VGNVHFAVTPAEPAVLVVTLVVGLAILALSRQLGRRMARGMTTPGREPVQWIARTATAAIALIVGTWIVIALAGLLQHVFSE